MQFRKQKAARARKIKGTTTGTISHVKMANSTVVDTTASTRQHLATVGYLSRKARAVKEPNKEKFRDNTKTGKK